MKLRLGVRDSRDEYMYYMDPKSGEVYQYTDSKKISADEAPLAVRTALLKVANIIVDTEDV